MSRPKIGKPNSGERKRKKYFAIEDGSNVYGILPPLFDLADKGSWSMFHRVEFGYKNSEGYMRPFISPRKVNKDRMVEVESAAHLKRVEIEDAFKKLKDVIPGLLKSGKLTKEEAKEKLDEMKKKVKRYNLESKHYMNAINSKGEIGLLKIPNRAMQGLRSLLKELKAKGKQMIPYEEDAQGLYINLHREGRGLDTVYTVSVVQKTVEVDGEQYEKDQKWTLSGDILDRLEGEAFQLENLFPTPTPEEVERIVKEGPTAVDEILNRNLSKDSETKNTTAEQKVEQRAEAVAEDKKEDVSDDSDLENILEAVESQDKVVTKSKDEPATEAVSKETETTMSSETEEDVDAWLDNLNV